MINAIFLSARLSGRHLPINGGHPQRYSTMNKLVENLKNRPDVKKGVEHLQKQTEKIVESDTVRMAREAFTKAKSATEEGASKAREKFEETAEKIGGESTGKSFFQQLREKSQFLWKSSIVQDVTGAVKDTKRFVVDDNASRYGGMTSKAFRNKIKQQRMAGFTESGEKIVEADPNAGATMVLHKDSKWKEAWGSFKDSNPVVQGIFTMRRKYEESDNAFVNSARFLTERIREMIGPAFEETEHAQALAEIRLIDPEFTLESFMKETREFMIPEVLEAYVYWDAKTLKQWCSEGVFNILEASREPTIQQGLEIEGKILDLRNVDLVMAKMMDDTPLLILTFKSQQIEVVRNKDGEVVGGSPDKINDVYFIWAVAKDAEKPNPLTKGWKVVEFAIQGVRESY